MTKEMTVLFENPDAFTVSFFSYEKDCSPLVSALEKFAALKRKENPAFKLCVFSPEGKSHDSFYKAWKTKKRNFSLVSLPYMDQLSWDAFLSLCSVNMIRGEDSFSRAALSSIPFLWHAYVQEGEFQLVKVCALLKRMKPFFSDDDYSLYLRLMLLYNRTDSFLEEDVCGEVLEIFEKENVPLTFSDSEKEGLFLEFFVRHDEIKKSFSDFSDSIMKNGNLALKLKSFCEKLAGL